LLNLIAGLDKATSGELVVGDDNLSKSSQKQLAQYRGKIGVIFQFYNLLPNLNTVENVLMGGWASGKNPSQSEAEALLKQFNLDHRSTANTKTLSGGEKQRVAICRSLIGNPEILLCDEPTGALDSVNETQVGEILVDLNRNKGLTVVMVTHNPEFAKLATQIIHMKDGLVVQE
jgi:putative ABC transport system ATP-binding protein